MYDDKEINHNIEILTQELKNNPNNYSALLSLSTVYYKKGEYDNAIEYLKEMIEIFQGNVKLYHKLSAVYGLLSIAYAQKKEYDNAIKYLEKAIEINPEDSKAYSTLGDVYLEKGEYGNAIKYLEKAIEINPKDAHSYCSLAKVYLQKKEYDKSVMYLEKAIEINPKDSEVYSVFGYVYLQKKEYNNTIKYWKKVIEINPKDSNTYVLIGVIYILKGEYNKAIEKLTETIKIDTENAYAYSALGDVYLEKGEYGNAIKYLEKAIEINPEGTHSYCSLAEVYLQKKEYDNAIKYLEKAIEINPENINYYCLLAKVYFKEKDYESAFNIFLKNKNIPIYSIVNALKNIFEIETIIPIEYKKILLAVYYLHDSLKINYIETFKKENTDCHLYQYRKFNFLDVVLETKNFWLNPTDYQNDPNEGKAFFDYINFKNIGKANTDLVAFISCFSALKDNLVMWNSSYAENGKGISIGIDIEKICVGTDLLAGVNIIPSLLTKQRIKENKIEDEKNIPINKIGLYKILYINLKEDKYTDKDKESKELLKDIKILYKNIIENTFYKDGSNEQKEKINNWLKDLFILIRYLVKYDDYEHEKEYRLLYIDNIKNSQYVKSQTCSEGVHIETEKFLFNNEEKKEFIFIGPRNNSKINMLKINHYLKSKNFDKYIEIKPSDIEFR